MTRACLVFGCGDPVTTRGRCARHAQQVDATRSLGTDRQAGAALYQTAQWKALRLVLLTRHPLCACPECVQTGRIRPAEVLHHLEAHGGDPARFFDVRNLQPLAKSCHDRLTATTTGTRGGRFSVERGPNLPGSRVARAGGGLGQGPTGPSGAARG